MDDTPSGDELYLPLEVVKASPGFTFDLGKWRFFQSGFFFHSFNIHVLFAYIKYLHMYFLTQVYMA